MLVLLLAFGNITFAQNKDEQLAAQFFPMPNTIKRPIYMKSF